MLHGRGRRGGEGGREAEDAEAEAAAAEEEEGESEGEAEAGAPVTAPYVRGDYRFAREKNCDLRYKQTQISLSPCVCSTSRRGISRRRTWQPGAFSRG